MKGCFVWPRRRGPELGSQRSPHPRKERPMPVEECPVDVVDLARFNELFAEHRSRVLAMLQWRSDRALAARRDPEDLLQDAYVRARGRWEDYKQSGMEFYPWLYRIALDCLYDDHSFHHRHCRSYRAEVAWPEQSSRQLLLGLVSPFTNPQDAAARDEYQRQLQEGIRRTLEALKPHDQEIIRMRFF